MDRAQELIHFLVSIGGGWLAVKTTNKLLKRMHNILIIYYSYTTITNLRKFHLQIVRALVMEL